MSAYLEWRIFPFGFNCRNILLAFEEISMTGEEGACQIYFRQQYLLCAVSKNECPVGEDISVAEWCGRVVMAVAS